MKNVLLGVFLLLSCQVMAQSLMDQYPILSKSTKFTKESPRYKGIPYDSAYLELKAGQRAWVEFDLRKAPLKVEIVRPSGQLDTLSDNAEGVFGLRILNHIYTASESGKHLFRFTYQDDDFKKLYRLSLGVLPPVEGSLWSAQDIAGQRLYKLAAYAPWEFKSLVTGPLAKGVLALPEKALPYYSAVSTHLFPFSKDYARAPEYHATVLENQTLNAVSGAYALLRSEILTYLRSKEEGVVIQDVPAGMLSLNEVRSCNFVLNLLTEVGGKARFQRVGLQLNLTEDLSKRSSSEYRYTLEVSLRNSDYRRRTSSQISLPGTTPAPTGTGEMQYPPLSGITKWTQAPSDFEDHLRKLCGMAKGGFEGISPSAIVPQPELRLIVGEKVMLNPGKSYTITLAEELLGTSREMTLIQLINHIMGALYQHNKTKIEYGTELNASEGIVQSFKLINPDHVVRLRVKQSKAVTGVVSSEVMEIIISKE